jgi:hypothetical protein
LTFLCVTIALIADTDADAPDQPPTSRSEPASVNVTGWDAFVAVWRIPLERVHIIGALVCIGAAPNLQRKMQFGKQTQGTPANLATMTSLGKIT